MGYSSDADILNLFYELEEVTWPTRSSANRLQPGADRRHRRRRQGVLACLRATYQDHRPPSGLPASTVVAIDTTVDDGAIIRRPKKDPTQNKKRRSRTSTSACAGRAAHNRECQGTLKRLFQDPRRYDLGRVGRYKLNQKLKMDTDLEFRIVADDVVEATKYLTRLSAATALSMTSTWAAVVCVPSASWPTSAAPAWPVPSAWLRSA